MSTNIAAGCEVKVRLSPGTCGVKWGEGLYSLFTGTISDCTTKVIDGSGVCNGLCYHNPTADNNVFIS
jgi:hypothetical protein